jgi:ADP-ribosylglycohydrolase
MDAAVTDKRPAPAPGSPDDRFRGLMYGAALGAAVALPCEGRDAHILRDNHEHARKSAGAVDDLKYPREGSKGPVRGYPANDWTGDFDQAVLAMWALRTKGPGPPFDTGIATLIMKWAAHGLSDLGDSKPVGIDSVTFRVVGHPDFLTDPWKAARETVGGGQLGSAPLVRALPLAALPLRAILDTVPRAAAVTHSDPRVVAATLFEILLLAPLVAGQDPDPEHVRYPAQKAMQAIVDVDQRKAFRETLDHTTTLEEVGLEYPDNAGHVTKTVRVVLWAFRQLLKTPKPRRGPEFFRAVIEEVALCGRNATEHAAIAGAVLGAALGYTGLPPEWVEGLPDAAWLEGEISDYLAAITAPPAQ